MTIHIPLTLITLVGNVALVYLFMGFASYALLFHRATWRVERWYLSLRWPWSLPATALYYVRWRRAEAHAHREGARHKSPARVVIAMAMAEQSRVWEKEPDE